MNHELLSWVFLAGMVFGAALVGVGLLIYRRVYKKLEARQVSGALDKGELPRSWVDLMEDFEESEAWVRTELQLSERERWKHSEYADNDRSP